MKKVKLSLNKTMIARLNGDKQSRIQGGEQPTTTGMGCIQNTDYPICCWSGWHGANATKCEIDTLATGDTKCWPND